MLPSWYVYANSLVVVLPLSSLLSIAPKLVLFNMIACGGIMISGYETLTQSLLYGGGCFLFPHMCVAPFFLDACSSLILSCYTSLMYLMGWVALFTPFGE